MMYVGTVKATTYSDLFADFADSPRPKSRTESSAARSSKDVDSKYRRCLDRAAWDIPTLSRIELGSVDDLKAALNQAGYKSKVWMTRKGKAIGGHPFSRGALFHLLRNPTYIGRIPHKEITYLGLHAPIVETAVFEAVQKRLADNAVARKERSNRAATAPLRGLIFDSEGAPMSPTFTYGKRNRIYRYYDSNGLICSGIAKGSAAVRRVAAEPLEAIVRERVLRAMPSPSWDGLIGHIVRVEIPGAAVRILVSNIAGDFDYLRASLSSGDRLEVNGEVADQHVKEVAVRPVFRGGRTWLVAPSGRASGAPAFVDPTMVKALRFAHLWQAKLNASPLTHIDTLWSARAAADSYVRPLTPTCGG